MPELQRLSVTVEVLRVGVMIVGVISVGVMTVGVLSVGLMTLSQIMHFNAARINLTKMIFFYNYAVLYFYTR